MKNLYFLLTLILLLAACQSEQIDSTVDAPTYNPPTGQLVDGTIRGNVIDVNGNGIEDAVVNFNNLSVSTDDTGFFMMEGQLDAAGTYVQVTKSGYFSGSRKIAVTADGVDFVNIQMVERRLTATVDAASGGPITVDEAMVELPGGIYRTESGEAYNGAVSVYAHYMDPKAEATFQQMPGELIGFSTEGELEGLITYGMVNVELQDASGNTLQLPTDQNATLTMPVPANLQNTAPSTIPLWYFDEDKGVWIEEGSAQLVNGEYIGDVSHFTIWNCDDPFEFVCIEGTLVFNNYPAANFTMQFTAPSLGLSGYTTTNNAGQFSIKVPLGEELTLTVSAGCGAVAQDISIGFFNADGNVGPINVSGAVENFTVVGSVETCGGGPVTNGVAEIYIDNIPYAVLLDSDGSFEYTFSNCTGADAHVVGIDRDNSMGSEPVVISASGYQDLGVLETCNAVELDDFVISYSGQNWALPSTTDSTSLLATYSDVLVPVTNGPNKTIRSITILDWLTAVVAEGEFIWAEGDTESTYNIHMPQGFDIAGTCDLQLEPFFKVTDTSTDITVTDQSIYPGNINEVYFHFRFD